MALSKDPQKRAKQLANLRKYKKGDVGNPNGRPLSVWGAFCRKCEEMGATVPSDNAEAFNAMLYPFSLTRSQLNKLINDEDLAMFERIAAREVLSRKSKDWLITLFRGLYGEKVNHDIKQEVKHNIEDIDAELKRLDELEKVYRQATKNSK
jgi:hypothetical protein